MIEELGKVDKALFSKLYEQLQKINIRRLSSNATRLGFGKQRICQFGKVRPRFKPGIHLSACSIKHQDIYEELKSIGDAMCPFPFTSINVNHNVTCPPHKDKNNKGKSMLVSFGEYSGCNIVIDGKTYDTNCNPIVFDGSKQEHYNTDDLSGNKYSLVYYSI